MKQVAKSKEGVESDDLTSMLVNAEVDGEKLTEAEIASFFVLLVVAGNETTRNAIGWGLTYLTDNPDQRELWKSDFDTLCGRQRSRRSFGWPARSRTCAAPHSSTPRSPARRSRRGRRWR